MREENIISLKIIQHLDSTELKVIRTTRLIRRNMWDKVLLNITYCSQNVSFGHLETLLHPIFSSLKLEPENLPVYLLGLYLDLMYASTSASACPCGPIATWRPPFSNRFPAQWIRTQTCFATVLLEEDLGDQLVSCCKFGRQRFAEQTLGILPMRPGQYAEPRSCGAAFTIDTGAASISVIVGKYKYLSSVNYIKEVNAYLNYEWSAAAECLDRGTFKGMYT